MALSTKENYMAAMEHKKPDWVPVYLCDNAGVGFCVDIGPWFEKGPAGGFDGL